jgi:hypothetical protein
MSALLPDPSLKRVNRLEATLGVPLDLGDVAQGHRRIVPLTGGTFRRPELNGTLLPRVSADWQIVLPDGTALGDIRYTVRTYDGALLYVQSRGVRHGRPEVLAASAEATTSTRATFWRLRNRRSEVRILSGALPESQCWRGFSALAERRGVATRVATAAGRI